MLGPFWLVMTFSAKPEAPGSAGGMARRALGHSTNAGEFRRICGPDHRNPV